MGNKQEINILLKVKGKLKSIRDLTYSVEADIDTYIDNNKVTNRMMDNKDVLKLDANDLKHLSIFMDNNVIKEVGQVKVRRVSWDNSFESIRDKASKANSISEMLKLIGLLQCGGNSKMVKKYINLYGVDVSHWRVRKGDKK